MLVSPSAVTVLLGACLKTTLYALPTLRGSHHQVLGPTIRDRDEQPVTVGDTSRYWLQKLFLTLESVQDSIVLAERVWLDETFYTVRSEDIIHNEDGTKPRGLSQNQICIGVATDKKNTLFLVEGTGKPTQKKTFEAFHNHIKLGSTLIHDRESAHSKLIKELSLESITYASSERKGLPDKDNPINPVNRAHAILKKFLYARNFGRKDWDDLAHLDT